MQDWMSNTVSLFYSFYFIFRENWQNSAEETQFLPVCKKKKEKEKEIVKLTKFSRKDSAKSYSQPSTFYKKSFLQNWWEKNYVAM